jgi:hypothetical protein
VGSGEDAPETGALVGRHLEPVSAEHRPVVGQQLLEEGRSGLHRTDVQHDPGRPRAGM